MTVLTRRAAALACSLILALGGGAAFAADAAPKVKFSTTAGDFVVEVYPDKAPKTVDNFLRYVKDHHYDGTIFHRVIDNFMIQGGGFDVNYMQKPTRPPVPHEGQEALAKGGPKNVTGTIAMARTSDPIRPRRSSSSTCATTPRSIRSSSRRATPFRNSNTRDACTRTCRAPSWRHRPSFTATPCSARS